MQEGLYAKVKNKQDLQNFKVKIFVAILKIMAEIIELRREKNDVCVKKSSLIGKHFCISDLEISGL